MRMFYFDCTAKSFRILRPIRRKNKRSHRRFPGSRLAHQQDLSCGISTLTFSGKRAQRVQFLKASRTLRFIVSYKLLFLCRSGSYTIVRTQISCVTTRNTFFPLRALACHSLSRASLSPKKNKFLFSHIFSSPATWVGEKLGTSTWTRKSLAKWLARRPPLRSMLGGKFFSNDHQNDARVACNLRGYDGRRSVVTFSSTDCVLY